MSPPNPTKSMWARYLYLILAFGDLLLIYGAFLGLYYFVGFDMFGQGARIGLMVATVAYIPAGWYLASRKANRRAILMERVMIRSVNAVIIHALFFMSLAAFLHVDWSMKFYAAFYGSLLVAFPVLALIASYILKRLRRKGMNQTKVAIVGTNNTARRLAEAMLKDPGFGYKVVGFFDMEPMPDFNGNYAGNIDDLAAYAAEHKVDEVYFTLVGEKAGDMNRVVKIADDNVLSFYYVPKISRYVNGTYQLHNIGPVPVLSLRPNPLSRVINRFFKRSFDIVFSSLVLVVLTPIVFVPAAVAIKLSSRGPVFFRQQRTGYRGCTFICYKFRTMKLNADADRAQATADDPRKTRVGDFMRRTSIDELPQFINVLKGEMSVVGPRPHMIKHTEDYTRLVDAYMVRHVVKPGITGWAQVNGYRGITDELWKMEKRVECDVWYIENWNFALDMKIIARTVMNAVHGEKNAF